MSNPRKKKGPIASKPKTPCTAHSWEVQHQPDHSEIEAYVEASGKWEIIADIKGVDHVALAGFIVQIVNRQSEIQNTINELTSALEFCLACAGKLTWEAEQEADVVCRQVRQHGLYAPEIKAPLPSGQSLSHREIEILSWTARGKTRKEISRLISISEETVKEYFEKILIKLNAVNKTHAVSIAAALGSISLYLKDIQNTPDDDAPQMGGEVGKESPHQGDAAGRKRALPKSDCGKG